MELIDVLTPDGRPGGIRKSKADVHRDGDWHRAAHVWIIGARGRILLQRRSMTKENNPGLWDVSAAGHVSAGETAMEAAVRETEEELGLRLSPSELQPAGAIAESCVLNGGTYIDREFHEIFIVRRDVDLQSLVLDPQEVAEVRWVGELHPDETFVPHAREFELFSRLAR